jgi:hypothetical protein
MAFRRQPRRRETQLAFEALSIEGGLLSPEWLARVAQLDAGSQGDADYRVLKGLNLRDEIGRYWRIAQAHWTDFASGRAAGADASKVAERFALSLLRDAFGFGTLQSAESVEIGGRNYPVGHRALSGRVPVVIAPAGLGLDTAASAFGDDGRRRSAFGLCQELLNADENALWGITTDGTHLRILRDNGSLTRPAWIEADLERIFTEERYADFAALWLLAHESRLGGLDQPVNTCPLETWRSQGREQGTRARDHLRGGVEDALAAFGDGFLAHPENTALHVALRDGLLTEQAYFQQLLRLVYRLLFLLTGEERDVLHRSSAPESAKSLYAQGYGVRRLRDRAVRRSAHDRFGDLWQGLQVAFRGLARGEERLALPALGGLFAVDQCPALDDAKLENRTLLYAIFRLSWLREDSGVSRVNWRDMGPEELGSVYESLLELVPRITEGRRRFSFATGGETKGNLRKTTGSYYTPDSLVQVLLDSALEPLVQETIAANSGDPVEGLLSLAIVDPACGSGHFLLSAGRRLAAHVARLQANGTPSAADYRRALRQVVGRCLFGVDLNPMAVELCKVSLWMEALEPGRPLSFLNSHVQRGNALLGATPELIARGIPDGAWDPIEGDDKDVASALKKRNKQGSAGQRAFAHAGAPESAYARLGDGARAIDDATDENLDAVEAKGKNWQALVASAAYERTKSVADTWCAAFFWPKYQGSLANEAPTNEVWRQVRDRKGELSPLALQTTNELSARHNFFHWHLAFPQVFARGGFDVILGNPPWDTLSPDRREYFSKFRGGLRSLSPTEQDGVITDLLADPKLAAAWSAHQRDLYGLVHFLKRSGRFTLYAPGNLGKGDFNVFRMFAELALKGVRPGGYAAQVLPGGIYAGANSSAIRQFMLNECELKNLWGFINTQRTWFKEVDIDRFAAFTARRGRPTRHFLAQFGLVTPADFANASVEFDADFIRTNSPDTYAIPDVRSVAELTVAAKMLARYPAFGDVGFGPPSRHYQREIDMGTDRELFTTDPAGLPLYEGRMVSHFDHRAKSYVSGHGNSSVWIERAFDDSAKDIVPQWRVRRESIPKKLGDRCDRFRLAFCDVANPRNERSLEATLVPPGVICGHKVPTIVFEAESEWRYLPWLAVANSFVMDWFARSKLSAPTMSYTIMDSLPFPRAALDAPWVREVAPLVLRLLCVTPEMTPFWNRMAAIGICSAVSAGTVPATALRDPGGRARARAEIDAIVALDVYGLTRVELADVLESFNVVRRRDIASHGAYVTKQAILRGYDERASAVRDGKVPGTRSESAVAAQPFAPGTSGGLASLPTPMPTLAIGEEIARIIWAIVHARGGSVLRIDLARAFSLLSQPNILLKLASNELRVPAAAWAERTEKRTFVAGALAGMLKALEEREGIRLTVDDSARSIVSVSARTPPVNLVGAWFEFEAKLALDVLAGLTPHEIITVDAKVAGDDRALLEITAA